MVKIRFMNALEMKRYDDDIYYRLYHCLLAEANDEVQFEVSVKGTNSEHVREKITNHIKESFGNDNKTINVKLTRIEPKYLYNYFQDYESILFVSTIENRLEKAEELQDMIFKGEVEGPQPAGLVKDSVCKDPYSYKEYIRHMDQEGII